MKKQKNGFYWLFGLLTGASVALIVLITLLLTNVLQPFSTSEITKESAYLAAENDSHSPTDLVHFPSGDSTPDASHVPTGQTLSPAETEESVTDAPSTVSGTDDMSSIRHTDDITTPATDDFTTGSPETSSSATDESASTEETTEEAAATEPGTSDSAAQAAPTTAAPTTAAPTTAAPTTAIPTTAAPTTAAPTTATPTTAAPTTAAPTTAAPTTAAPTTAAPTTAAPTTAAPTTAAPTTAAPTTAAPTTAAPTTAAPTTAAPTTAAPTTAAPTTAAPTTPPSDNPPPATTDPPTTVSAQEAAAAAYNNESNTIVQEILRLMNEERAKKGVPALTLNTAYQPAAHTRVLEIAQNFSHMRPDGNGPWEALNERGYAWSQFGENIANFWPASGSSTDIGTKLYNMWKNSSTHYESMISRDFTQVTMEVYCVVKDGTIWVYAVQIFTAP